MCHHWDLADERLYEAAREHEELPDWANEESEPDEPDETEETPIAPSATDD